MNKKQVREFPIITEYKTVQTLDPYDFEGPIDDVIGRLTKLKVDYYGRNLVLTYIGDDDYHEYYLYEKREETDEEYDKRINADKHRALEREKHERKQYEQLKAKFEKGGK